MSEKGRNIEKFRAISGHFRDLGVIGVEFTAESSGEWTQIANKALKLRISRDLQIKSVNYGFWCDLKPY
jgi:hypothetical protein